MAREIGSIGTQHKNQLASEYPFIWLYEVDTGDDPLTTIRITNYSKAIAAQHPLSPTSQTYTWYPAPVVHGGVQQTAEGSLPTISITVGNASLEVGSYVERLSGMVGNTARIWLISSLDTTDLSSGVYLEGEIVAAKATAESLVFQFASFNPFNQNLPRYLFASTRCRWLYGSAQCGATPGEGTVPVECPGFTLAACEQVGAAEKASGLPVKHPQQFGGFPGIPK